MTKKSQEKYIRDVYAFFIAFTGKLPLKQSESTYVIDSKTQQPIPIVSNFSDISLDMYNKHINKKQNTDELWCDFLKYKLCINYKNNKYDIFYCNILKKYGEYLAKIMYETNEKLYFFNDIIKNIYVDKIFHLNYINNEYLEKIIIEIRKKII